MSAPGRLGQRPAPPSARPPARLGERPAARSPARLGERPAPPSARSPARLGRAAERVALDHYAARGFDVLATNARFGPLEADLVVRTGSLVALVEVRARRPGALVGAFASVGAVKRRRLRRAARALWSRLRASMPRARVRIDVAAVDLWSCPVSLRVVEGAFPVLDGAP
ncbi:MAG TPA: YraN family protein [Polyangiaceae bacterium]|nr:YraN family protein [Polyangiaceae bacterium]